ncbi:MAG: hypothetical protein ACI9HY_004403, partial [Planctomycetaceae bacterium]
MKSTYTLSIVTGIILITWLISGQIQAPEVSDNSETENSALGAITRVQTRISEAAPYTVQIRASGQTEAKRTVKV